MSNRKIVLKTSDDDPDVAYLYLPKHPGGGKANVVAKQICLSEIIDGYKGPDVYLDFGHDDELIGIEIL